MNGDRQGILRWLIVGVGAVFLAGCASAPSPVEMAKGGVRAAGEAARVVGDVTNVRNLPSHTDAQKSVEEKRESASRRIVRRDTVTAPTVVISKKTPAWTKEKLPTTFELLPLNAAARLIVGWRTVHFTIDARSQPATGNRIEEVWVRGLNSNNATVAERLDAICLQMDLAWEADERSVTISDYASQTFRLPVPLASRSTSMVARNLNLAFSSGDTGGGISGGQGAGSLNRAEFNSDPLDELETVIAQALAGEGLFNISPSTNILSVRARPSAMRRVEKAVDDFVASASRRVSLEIAWYEVDVTNTRHRALDLRLLRTGILEDYISNVAFTFSGTGADFLSASDDPGGVTFNAAPLSAWDGSSAVLRWLNQQAETELVNRTNLETAHGQMVSLEGLVQTEYISEISRDERISGPSQSNSVNVETQTIDQGSIVHILPILNEKEITLLISVSVADLIRLDEYSFDQGRIAGALPTVSGANQLLNVRMRSGESRLVVNLGRRSVKTSRKQQPWLPILGRSKLTAMKDVETVMLVSGVILES